MLTLRLDRADKSQTAFSVSHRRSEMDATDGRAVVDGQRRGWAFKMALWFVLMIIAMAMIGSQPRATERRRLGVFLTCSTYRRGDSFAAIRRGGQLRNRRSRVELVVSRRRRHWGSADRGGGWPSGQVTATTSKRAEIQKLTLRKVTASASAPLFLASTAAG